MWQLTNHSNADYSSELSFVGGNEWEREPHSSVVIYISLLWGITATWEVPTSTIHKDNTTT